MPIHEYRGEEFCITPIDGVPCLGSKQDSTLHVQPLGSRGSSLREQGTWISLPENRPFVIVRDAGVFRRYAAWAYESLPAAVEGLKAEQVARPQERIWIERR